MGYDTLLRALHSLLPHPLWVELLVHLVARRTPRWRAPQNCVLRACGSLPTWPHAIAL